MKQHLSLGLISFICSSAYSLESGDAPTLFDLSLNELMQVSFSVSVSEATDREESILKTPAIVSRYEADNLSRMGLASLKDFLSFVPGIVWDEGAFGNGQIMVRGISENFGQKVLFMLDDVPYWQPAHSAFPLLGIPMSTIDHIEVIRGPGLVQQGSGATTGVIKIVTKKNVEKKVAMQIGSNEHANGRFYVGNAITPNQNIAIGGEYQDEDGFLATYENPEFNVSSTNKRAEKVASLFARYTLNHDNHRFNLTGHHYQSEVNGVNNASSLLPNTLTYKGDLLALSYALNHSDSFNIDFYSDYNRHHLLFDIDNFPFDGSQGRLQFDDNGNNNFRWRSGTKASLNIMNNLRWVLGYEYEKRETGNYEISSTNLNQFFGVAIREDQTNEQSLFTNIDWNYEKWRVLAGLRYVNNNDYGEEYLPQFSVVYSLTDYQSIKALYSVGFNSPNFFQTGIFIPNPPPPTVGNPDLLAEKVESFDFSYTYFRNSHQIVVNGYYFEAFDFIQRINTGSVVTAENSLEFERWGYELDYQSGFKKLRHFINLSYQHQGNQRKDNDRQARLVPKYTASLGGYYALTQAHEVGASLRYLGKRYSPQSLVVEAYHWLNLQYRYHNKNWEFSFSLVNILDDQITNPDVDSNTTQIVMHSDGFGYNAGFSWRF